MSSTEQLPTADGCSSLLFIDVLLILVLEETVNSGALPLLYVQVISILVVLFPRDKSPGLFNHSLSEINPDL